MAGPRACTRGVLHGPSSQTPGFTLLLPRTLIHGDKKGGFSIFWADDGLDTGDLLLQKECEVLPDDTVSTLYNRFLFPEGIKGMVRAWSRPRPAHPDAHSSTLPRPSPLLLEARNLFPKFRILEGESSHFKVLGAELGQTVYRIRRDSCSQRTDPNSKSVWQKGDILGPV